MDRLAKHKPGRSEEYLDYIRRKRCLVCRKSPVEPHHTETGGIGMKGSDFATVPLCRQHHREVHDIGKITFQGKYEKSFPEVIKEYKVQWLYIHPMTSVRGNPFEQVRVRQAIEAHWSQYGNMPEVLLMSKACEKVLLPWLKSLMKKTTNREQDFDSLNGCMLWGLEIISIMDEIALTIPGLDLDNILIGSKGAAQEVLNEE